MVWRVRFSIQAKTIPLQLSGTKITIMHTICPHSYGCRN